MTTVDRRGVTRLSPGVSPATVIAAAVAGIAIVAGIAVDTEIAVDAVDTVDGTLAIGVGAVLALLVLLLAPPYWFALSQVAVLATIPDASWLSLAVVEGGLLVALAVATVSESGLRAGVALVVVSGLGAAIGLGAYRLLESLWPATLVLLGCLALAVYGLYRYGLVRLGVVGGTS